MLWLAMLREMVVDRCRERMEMMVRDAGELNGAEQESLLE